MEFRSLPPSDHQDEKKNLVLNSNKQRKENFISKTRSRGNNNITKKKIKKSISQTDNKTKQTREFTKNLKLNLKDTEKKTVSKEKKISSSNKNKNSSNILKKDIIKIKIQKSPNKMNINKETSPDRTGSGRGTGGATKIPSSHPSQSKQFQSTMDSFNKRVNKGKRK